MRGLTGSLCLVLTLVAQGAWSVDGVLEINAVCAVNTGCFAGDTAGYPVTITTSGSYRLTSNLDSGSTTAITASADHVSIDLNGFVVTTSVLGVGGAGDYVSLRNGSVVSGFVNGINLSGDYAEVSRVRVTAEVSMGDRCHLVDSIVVGFNNVVDIGDDCRVERSYINGGSSGTPIIGGLRLVVDANQVGGLDGGVIAGAGSRITNNTFERNDTGSTISSSFAVVTGNTLEGTLGEESNFGISCSSCVVEDNTVWNFGDFGLRDLAGTTAYEDNQFENNNGGNASPQTSGALEVGDNVCGGNTTCP